MKLYSMTFVAGFLLSSLSITCSETNNNHIGTLDLSILKRSIDHNGKTALEEAVMAHKFEQQAPMEKYPPIYWKTPFCITYKVYNDGSSFTKEVYDKIYARLGVVGFASRNKYNNCMYDRNYTHIKVGTYIDDCSSYCVSDDIVEVTARFYDKNVLLAALSSLK